MERNPSQNNQRDKQLKRLAGQLRDTGIAPDRDLWPEIQAAMDQADAEPVPQVSRPKKGSWLRFTAVAAALTLMLAAGWVGVRSITSEVSLPDLVVESDSATSGLAVIDQALDELVLALVDDPENRNLSHLVLMVHKTRGNLLRRNSENLVRE